ncbi:hypothetical protein [Streptomyces sp. NPDC048639]|uniref:hypothetical protein n=1 Tax=Streptomyces sp. NPDC048639 TaxID=3365581 RepID=UPI003721FD58
MGVAGGLARSAADRAPEVWAGVKRQWSGHVGLEDYRPFVLGLLAEGEQLRSIHRISSGQPKPAPPKELYPRAFDQWKNGQQADSKNLLGVAASAYVLSGAMEWIAPPDVDFPGTAKRTFYGSWESQGGQLVIALHAQCDADYDRLLVITDDRVLIVRVMRARNARDLGPAELGWGVRRTDVLKARRAKGATSVDLWFADDSWLRVWDCSGQEEALCGAFPSCGGRRWPGE